MPELLVLFSNPILAIIIIVLILMLIRELIMWYWKINRLVKTQETQEDILVDIHQELVEIRKKLDKID
jgi:ABC-type siderophore export system fused ATPase/permease subunit